MAGNSIRKAYICNSSITGVAKNDIVYFYLSGKGLIEAIGIVDEYSTVRTLDEIKTKVKNVSVYQNEQLDKFLVGRKKVTILMFRLVTYLRKPISKQLINQLNAYKAKFVTISQLSEDDYLMIKQNNGIDGRFIIN